VHHLLKFRLAGEFFQTSPEFGAVLLLNLGCGRREIELFLFARTNFFAMRLAGLWVVIHLRSSLRDWVIFLAPTQR
jgi:hypothetical protein